MKSDAQYRDILVRRLGALTLANIGLADANAMLIEANKKHTARVDELTRQLDDAREELRMRGVRINELTADLEVARENNEPNLPLNLTSGRVKPVGNGHVQ